MGCPEERARYSAQQCKGLTKLWKLYILSRVMTGLLFPPTSISSKGIIQKVLFEIKPHRDQAQIFILIIVLLEKQLLSA